MTWRRINSRTHRSSSGRYELRRAWSIEAGEVVYGPWFVWVYRGTAWECLGQADTIGQVQAIANHDLWHGPRVAEGAES